MRIVGVSNPAQQQALINNTVPAMMMGFWGGLETMCEVADRFLVVVRNSSGDVAKDVRVWAKECFPSEGISTDDITDFLVVFATETR